MTITLVHKELREINCLLREIFRNVTVHESFRSMRFTNRIMIQPVTVRYPQDFPGTGIDFRTEPAKGFMIFNEHNANSLYVTVDVPATIDNGILIPPETPVSIPCRVNDYIGIIADGADTDLHIIVYY